MSNAALKGIVAASVTPVTADFRIDTVRLKAHIDHLLANGCSFISTFGTTGEGASFSTAQKLEALKALKADGVEMGRQLPAIMTPSFDDAVTSLIAYGELGCRAALVLPPFYYGASEDGVAAFFDALIERTKAHTEIALVLYNIPQLSRVRFTQPLIAALLRRHGSRIAGIKDSTGDLDNGLMLVKSFPELAVFTGDDRVLPTLVKAGGAGMIGGMPNVFTRDLRALYDNPDDAGLLEKQSRRIEAVDAYGSLVALKAALAHYRNDESLAYAVPPLVALNQCDRVMLIELFERTGYRAAA
ncbi:Dihydrodipicolinate synthase [Neorhizobium galegae bv. officinalis bv. officinalis str. HAMBI 1141]|uniref:Dihydrodipicolinate synthase n=1 Tax=Neorhizobium galegae bv. officinalis bv. officinalis str. HAMBI 1141 TaxID=1028801 RepID=A0A068TBG1_NEOGA|nr:dihydrodipicolinate synthase family protein [Neorhizobium galegae]CDN55798.1 Dihydrodipicolinate synthase [Neorhizobium galegae bv. officinalis bv. officinalis str. HAMBI 1141]